ncbi:hypothetical protein T492DRAFT_941264, partial [Pavlovales sp. CCMP2436]
TLRLCIRLLHKPSLQPQLLELLGALLQLPPQLFAPLAERIGTGLLLLLRANAPHMAATEPANGDAPAAATDPAADPRVPDAGGGGGGGGGVTHAGRGAGAAGWATVCALLQQLLEGGLGARAGGSGGASASAEPEGARTDPASELAFEALSFVATDGGCAHVSTDNLAALSGLLLACAREARMPRCVQAVGMLEKLQLRACALRPTAPATLAPSSSREPGAAAPADALLPLQALCNLLRAGVGAPLESTALASLLALVCAPELALLTPAELMHALSAVLVPLFEARIAQLHAARAAPAPAAAAGAHAVGTCARLCAVVSRMVLQHLHALAPCPEFPQLFLHLVGAMTGALGWTAAEAALQPLHEQITQNLRNMTAVIMTAEDVRQDVRALLRTVIASFLPDLHHELIGTVGSVQ